MAPGCPADIDMPLSFVPEKRRRRLRKRDPNLSSFEGQDRYVLAGPQMSGARELSG